MKRYANGSHLDQVFDAMNRMIDGSRERKERSSAFHAAILLFADDLQNVDAHEICKRLGFTPTHYTEVRKTVKAHAILKRMGYKLTKTRQES